MQRKLLSPSRLAAAAALALGGLIAGPSVVPAKAGDCVGYKLYVYGNKQGPIVGDRERHCAVPTPWYQWIGFSDSWEHDTDELPPGTPTGFGYGVWAPAP